MRKILSRFVATVLLSIITFSSSVFVSPSSKAALPPIDYKIAVFGDSNSAGFAGIQTWVSKLQSSVNPNTQNINFIITNYAVGGTTMTKQAGLNSFRDTPGFQTFMSSSSAYADLAIIMLGSNDAYLQVPTATYTSNYRTFLDQLYASGKVGDVLALSTPPMMSPWNCIGSTCPVYSATNNPNSNWINPYNSYLQNNLASYCNTISAAQPGKFPMRCSYLNTASSMQANSTYLYSDGIHILDYTQQIIANLVKNTLYTYARKYINSAPAYLAVANKATGNSLLIGGVGAYSSYVTARLSRNSLPIAETAIDLRLDRNWSTVSADVDLSTYKSVVSNLAAVAGNSSTYSLYVPKSTSTTSDALKICPGATTLADVNAFCTGGYILTASSPNVSTLIVGSTSYWVVSGLSGRNGGLGDRIRVSWPLTAPTYIAPADGAIDQPLNIELQWNAVQEDPLLAPITYNVYIGESAETMNMVSTGQPTTTFAPTTLQPGRTYFWQVVAKDNTQDTKSGAVWSFSTYEPQLLTAPVHISPVNGAVNQELSTTLNWSASAVDPVFGPVKYDVYLGDAIDNLAIVSTNQTTTNFVSALQHSKTYYWKVVAKDTAGNTKASTMTSFGSYVPIPLTAPTNIWPVNNSKYPGLNVSLKWNAATADPLLAPITYDVYLGESAGSLDLVAANLSGTSFNPANLEYGKLYYWQVWSKDKEGNVKSGPIWFFGTILLTRLSPPVNISPSNEATNQALNTALSWNQATVAPELGPVKYDVYLGTSAASMTLVSSNQTATSYNATLQHSKTYYWKVAAKDSVGGTESGETWKFSTYSLLAVATNLAKNKPIISASGVLEGTAASAVDGWKFSEGAPNSAVPAVRLAANGYIIIDLGNTYKQVKSMKLQADNNDSYVIETSVNNRQWRKYAVTTAGNTNIFTTKTLSGSGRPERFIRIRPLTGDGNFRISELEVYQR